MMPGLERIYDAAFFREWGPRNEPYVESARRIVEVVCREMAPRRLADVGAGCGVYSDLFRGKGVDAVAIDGVLPPEEDRFPGSWEIRDLTVPFENVWGPFDLVFCLEVAEHIPEEFCDVFLANLCRLGDTLLISAAPPNQGGTHHVNERPKRYWIERLRRHGFLYNRRRTGIFVETFKKDKIPFMWMCQHLSVYERETIAENRGRRRSRPGTWSAVPLSPSREGTGSR